MYGFHKARKENTRSVFSHPYFLRNKEYRMPLCRHLLCLVRRKIKNADEQQDSSPQQLPEVVMPHSVKSIKELPQQQLSKPNSNARLEMISPIKSLISTNELIKTNINISIRRISFCDIDSRINLEEDDDCDCVSIADVIEQHEEPNRRVVGLSLITTSIFLQELRENY